MFRHGLKEMGETDEEDKKRADNNSPQDLRTLENIKAAVYKAVLAHMEFIYYENTTGLHRMFHGNKGIVRAGQLKENVFQCHKLNEAITQINIFLTARDTPKREHSFATYLLRGLQSIEDSPWNGFGENRSNFCF